MKKIAALIFIAIIQSVILSQWFIVNHISNYQFYSLYFMSNTTGCVGGNQNGVIFKTTDSGGNFSSIPTGTNIWFLDIFFINPLTGWACGQNGYVVKTTTGGNNWFQVFQAANYLHSIRFIDASTGYTCGYSNVYKTTNGGTSWTYVPTPYSSYFLGTSFINANTGFIVSDAGLIARTTNGGTNWQTMLSGSGDYFEEIVMSSPNTGYVAGRSGRIMKSTNGGLNWFNQTSNTGDWLFDLYFINDNRGWACGENGRIIYTSNGGTNWAIQYVPTISIIRQVHFLTPDTGYAVTDNGMILKTYTAGVLPINIISTEIPKSYSLEQNYPNPFNPSTKIRFSLPNNNFIQLKVYNINGKEISTLINADLKAGKYEITFDAQTLSSGIYIYQLTSGDFKDVKKMVIVK